MREQAQLPLDIRLVFVSHLVRGYLGSRADSTLDPPEDVSSPTEINHSPPLLAVVLLDLAYRSPDDGDIFRMHDRKILDIFRRPVIPLVAHQREPVRACQARREVLDWLAFEEPLDPVGVLRFGRLRMTSMWS